MQTSVQGKTYNYIQYAEGDEKISSVVGFIVPIDSNSKKKLLNTGGFYRDLTIPLFKDEQGKIKRIVILSVTGVGMKTLTGFFFDDETNDMEVNWTTEPKIGPFYSRNIKDKGVDFETINTLEFLANETDTSKKFFEILTSNYYNPISIEDTGVKVNGEIVKYGQTVMINDVQTIVQKIEHLKDGNLGKLNVDKIELTLYKDGLKLMGTIGDGKLINKDGKVITVIEDNYASYANEGQSFEEFINEYNFELIENTAYSINEGIKRRPHRKESIMEDYISIYEKHLKESSEPMSEMIGLNFLLACIKENLVTLAK